MTSRAVFILSTPRSGSSALAGAMDALGVDMGKQYDQPKDFLNPKGYFESRNWQLIHKSLSGNAYTVRFAEATQDHLEAYRRLIVKCSQAPIWGCKSPRLAYTLHFIKPLLQEAGVDIRIVVARRDFESIVQSFKRHTELAYQGRWPMTEDQARAHMGKWLKAVEWQLAQWDGPVCEMDYDQLLEEPVTELCTLHDFCFEDLDIPGHKRIITPALNWLERGLRHFDGHHHTDVGPNDGDNGSKQSLASGWTRKRECGCRGRRDAERVDAERESEPAADDEPERDVDGE